MFLKLARNLSSDQPVYGLQAVEQFADNDRPITVEEMAAHYVREIRSAQPNGPYYLGGYSLGGIFAYEIAQQLTSQGQCVRMLALLDTHFNCRVPAFVRFRLLVPRLFYHARRWLSLPRGQTSKYIKERWATFWLHLGRPSVDTAKRVGKFRILASRYRLKKYQGAVDLFTSEGTHQGMPRVFKYFAGRGLRTHHVSGNHTSMMDEHVHDLAQALQDVIDLAQ